jgi:glycosyltransferase involved in cell wall biosynthesis
MAIAEAMAVGVPVVTSNRCGMPYMIDHGQSGFLVDPEKSADVAQRLTELLQNPWQRESFGACARTAAREHFHPDLVVDKTLQAYHSILAEAQPSSSSAAHPHAAMPAARG